MEVPKHIHPAIYTSFHILFTNQSKKIINIHQTTIEKTVFHTTINHSTHHVLSLLYPFLFPSLLHLKSISTLHNVKGLVWEPFSACVLSKKLSVNPPFVVRLWLVVYCFVWNKMKYYNMGWENETKLVSFILIERWLKAMVSFFSFFCHSVRLWLVVYGCVWNKMKYYNMGWENETKLVSFILIERWMKAMVSFFSFLVDGWWFHKKEKERRLSPSVMHYCFFFSFRLIQRCLIAMDCISRVRFIPSSLFHEDSCSVISVLVILVFWQSIKM